MLCFLFAALIVALDQFFKRWILRTLDVGEIGPELVPGVIGLTRWENDGAMLNILSGQQWLLAGIAFGAAVVLVMILLRYNEGFWGTLGLAAVLGGTVGNLIDRIFHDGKVVDMFRTLFINFPIFNIADIFITLGFITFLIHFIALSFKGEGDKEELAHAGYDGDEYLSEQEDDRYDTGYDEFPDIDAIVSAQSEQEVGTPSQQNYHQPQYSRESQYAPSHVSEPQYLSDEQDSYEYETDESMSDSYESDGYESITDTTDSSFSLEALEAELGSLEGYADYDVDDLLREYGFEDDDDNL